MLDVTSRGSAHIQSPDPLYEPLVSAKTLTTKEDQQNWIRMIRVSAPRTVLYYCGSA